jgi:NTP pyrophosphatase (non-canonical NTP hydrolase)
LTTLTFATLRQVNVARCIEGWKHPLESWSLDDWIIAVAGELGEALNLVKKLNRARDGIIGNSQTVDELTRHLADEIADAAIYLDLLLARYDTSIEQQCGYADFTELRNYTRAHADERDEPSRIGREAVVALAKLASTGRAMSFLHALDGLAAAYGIALGDAIVAKFNRTSEKHGMPHRLQEAA